LPSGAVRRIIGAGERVKRRSAVPRHWWIALETSPPEDRKKEVYEKVEAKKGKGSCRGFWKDENEDRLYALVRADTLEEALKRDIRAIDATAMQDVRKAR
jgi:hypothetical protein